MKKVVFFVLLAFFTLGGACRDEVVEPDYFISDFVPFTPNAARHFIGGVTVPGTQSVTELYVIYMYDYVRENVSQRRVVSFVGGEENIMVEFNAVVDDRYMNISAFGSLFDRSDRTGEMNVQAYQAVILQEPMLVGNSWTRFQSTWLTERAVITSMDTEVTVPFGTFAAMVVEITGSDGSATREFYVAGIGLVRTETVMPNGTRQILELAEIVEGYFEEFIPVFTGWVDVPVLGWITYHVMDEDGEPLFDEYGMAVLAQKRDEDGELIVAPRLRPMIDEFGNLIYDEYGIMMEYDEPWMEAEPVIEFIPVEFYTNNDVASVITDALRLFVLSEYGFEIPEGVRILSLGLDRHSLEVFVDMSSQTTQFLESLAAEFGEATVEILVQLFIDTIIFIQAGQTATVTINDEAFIINRAHSLYRPSQYWWDN